MNRIRKSIYIIPMAAVIIACSFAAPAALPTIIPSEASQPTTVVMSATIPPTQIPSSTPTVPIPTWTALPTMDPNTSLHEYFTWLEGNDACRLPCWAGITPKNTSWDEAEHILQPLTGIAKLEIRLDRPCIFGKCNYVTWALLSDLNTYGNLYSKEDVNTIHLIQLQFVDPYLVKALNLQSILNTYGKPAILLFSTEPDLPGDLYLELILVYPNSQFIIKYSEYAKLSDNKIVSCGQDSSIELIILDNKEQLMSVDAIANAVETDHLNVDVWRKPVEVATGMTIDEFYETFKIPDAPCITTPINVWRQ